MSDLHGDVSQHGGYQDGEGDVHAVPGAEEPGQHEGRGDEETVPSAADAEGRVHRGWVQDGDQSWKDRKRSRTSSRWLGTGKRTVTY